MRIHTELGGEFRERQRSILSRSLRWSIWFSVLISPAFTIAANDHIDFTRACGETMRLAAKVQRDSNFMLNYGNHPRFRPTMDHFADVFLLLGRIPYRIWDDWADELSERADSEFAERRVSATPDILPPDFFISRPTILGKLESTGDFNPLELKLLVGYLESQLPAQKPKLLYDATRLTPIPAKKRRLDEYFAKTQQEIVELRKRRHQLTREGGEAAGDSRSRQVRRLAPKNKVLSPEITTLIIEKMRQIRPGIYSYDELTVAVAEMLIPYLDAALISRGADLPMGSIPPLAIDLATFLWGVFDIYEIHWDGESLRQFATAVVAEELSETIDQMVEFAKARRAASDGKSHRRKR